MRDVHVRVRVGRELYALPVANVLEVAELGEVTAVPGAGRSVLGIRNLNGQVLPIFDLACVFGIAREGVSPRVVVAELDGQRAGLAVDEVTDVGELGSQRESADVEYLTEAVVEAGSLVGVVDVEQVFAALGRESG
jgi:purine-binding chemotaxis protein CheW